MGTVGKKVIEWNFSNWATEFWLDRDRERVPRDGRALYRVPSAASLQR